MADEISCDVATLRALVLYTYTSGQSNTRLALCCVLWWRHQMETFRVTDPLRGESTGHRWIPLTKASDAELWCFLLCTPEQTVGQTVYLPVLCDATKMSMWRHYDGFDLIPVILLIDSGSCHCHRGNHCTVPEAMMQPWQAWYTYVTLTTIHYSDVTWASWLLKSLTFEQLGQTKKKETPKCLITCPLWGESTSDWWIPLTKGQ